MTTPSSSSRLQKAFLKYQHIFVFLAPLLFVVGVYVAMRDNGRPSAQAAAGSAVATGLLAVLAIAVVLVTSG